MSDTPLKVTLDRDGKLLRLRLNTPKPNIVDAAMIGALSAALDAHANSNKLRGVLLEHEGPHFSFGASVAEHMPDQCAQMLKSLHALILKMAAYPLPILVAIKGQCLGGGLEVALAGHLMFVSPDARLGQPEIQLAVFAPAASCLLPERLPRAIAEDMLYSGRSITGAEAAHFGMANGVSEDPEVSALAYFDASLAKHSATSLRFAVTAARQDLIERLSKRIAFVEELYLKGLMATKDAVEGLTAFIEKRPARWEDQ